MVTDCGRSVTRDNSTHALGALEGGRVRALSPR